MGDTWRYHPLLAEMLRSELQAHRPEEAQGLNRAAAAIMEARGDIAGALRAHGELLELRAGDLRFTSGEADAFLNGRLGLGLMPEELDRLVAGQVIAACFT